MVTGVSGGGYGASLNVHRVRAAFPEATVHLLADSAPMVQPIHFEAWKTEWNLQLPPGCAAKCVCAQRKTGDLGHSFIESGFVMRGRDSRAGPAASIP